MLRAVFLAKRRANLRNFYLRSSTRRVSAKEPASHLVGKTLGAYNYVILKSPSFLPRVFFLHLFKINSQSINELLVISVEVTRKISKFSQLIGAYFSVNCVVFPYFPTSLSPYHPKPLTYNSLKQPYHK